MPEFWEPTHIRGQQTNGVWVTFSPAFTVGELTLTAHQTDVALLLTHVTERGLAQDAYDDAISARDTNYNLLRDLNKRGPQLIASVLALNDELQREIGDITALDSKGQEAVQERARLLVSLWTRVNARRAAMTPPQPALTVGTMTLAQFQAALTLHATLLQTVADKESELSRKKSQLKTTDARVDRNNKRWYAAWDANFPVGSPENEALALITTEEGTATPAAQEIATATASGLNAALTYAPGGGAHATSLQLVHKVGGVETDFGHAVPVILAGQQVGPFTAGQVVQFKVLASNSAGTVESAVKIVTF